jgi:hypothetical protein
MEMNDTRTGLLLAGSIVMNRKRDDVTALVSIFTGLLKASVERRKKVCIPINNGYWEIRWGHYDDKNMPLFVCYSGSEHDGEQKYVFDARTGWKKGAEYVSQVHRDLDVLLDGLLKEFPEIAIRVAWFINIGARSKESS